MKTILVTGGAGFIGSNFIASLLKTKSNVRVVNLDKLTYAGNIENLSHVSESDRYEFVEGDICNRELVESLFKARDIRGVFHLAAESHVDNSIAGPAVFVQTNVVGTFNLLEAARAFWMAKPGVVKPEMEDCRFLHVSTDEVFGALGEDGAFSETTPYAPNSPYSATKAGSDFLVRSYFHTYGMNVVTTNCSNNYGPRQHGEKLIPTIIRNAIAGKNIPIYGRGLNIRDWLFVDDHCLALIDVYSKGRAGETYNVGTRNEQRNIDLAMKICETLNKLKPNADIGDYRKLMTYVDDRPGHDHRYAIDPSKIEKEIGWKPLESFESGLEKTILWYLSLYAKEASTR